MVVELRADLGDEREVLETRELAGRHGEDTSANEKLFSQKLNRLTLQL